MEHLELQWRLYTAKENNGSDGGGKDDEVIEVKKRVKRRD